MAVNPIPAGHHTVTPYLIVRGAPRVIDFLQRAFDAELTHAPLKRPDGTIMHAEVQIGGSRVMIAEESQMAKAAPSSLYLYVPTSIVCIVRQSRPAARRSWSRWTCFMATVRAA